MTLNYEISANLKLSGGGGGFQRSMTRMSDRVRSFADRLRGARGMAGGLMRSLVSLGAGYVGFHALSAGVRSVVGGMFEFNRQLETTKIGMQTILSAVDGISFDAAGESAERVFAQLNEDAITSIATGQDLAGIFTGIVGPLRGAGASLETVRDITLQAATAAAAMGIDFGQAQRDIGMMATGVAGTDVALFRTLRNMGRITQSTEEWNQELTATERVTALNEALSAFEPGGAAFGGSLEGLIATFKGLVQTFGRVFSGPGFERIKQALSDVNGYLIENRQRIETFLTSMGVRLASALDRVFEAAQNGFRFVLAHWDSIAEKMQEFGTALRANGPHLARLAAAMGALSSLRSVLAPVLTALSAIMSIGEGAAAIFGGGAAAEGGAAAAGASGAAAFAPLLAALAVVAGVVLVVTENWQAFVTMAEGLLPIFVPMIDSLQGIGAALWNTLRPALKGLGALILSVAVPAFFAFIAVLRIILPVIEAIMVGLATFAGLVETYIVDPFIAAILAISQAIAYLLGDTLGEQITHGAPAAPTDPAVERMLESMQGEQASTGRTGFGLGGATSVETPQQRPQTVNNFHRGAVQVRQEFRQADPDRVMVRMVNDIDAQAERRVQSGFAPALSR